MVGRPFIRNVVLILDYQQDLFWFTPWSQHLCSAHFHCCEICEKDGLQKRILAWKMLVTSGAMMMLTHKADVGISRLAYNTGTQKTLLTRRHMPRRCYHDSLGNKKHLVWKVLIVDAMPLHPLAWIKAPWSTRNHGRRCSVAETWEV